MAFLDKTGLAHLWSHIVARLGTKVDKEDGKGLSTNDYTTEEKTKLAGIAEGATNVIVDSAFSSTSTNPVQNKVVNSAISNLNTLVGDTAVSTQINTAVSAKADASDLTSHTEDNNIHITSTERTNWNVAKSHADSAHAPSNAEENQNAFSNITVDGTIIAADLKTDTLTIIAGDNVTLTPDAANDKLTITAKDTVYTHPTYIAKSSGLYKVAVDGTGHVSEATGVVKDDIVALGIPAQDTIYSEATTSVAGLMSASDKDKLNGIEDGANKTIVDSALSTTSTNPVQNKVIDAAISNLNALVGENSVATQISNAIANKSDSDHTHDDRYYTETEIDSKLSGKSDTSHTHDDRYYTETEMDTKLSNKVDKVDGSRLITASEATKLESLVLGDSGQVEISGKVNASNVEGLDELLATKVDKVTGMGLSTNDYTTNEKNKLAGIEAGANKTVVDTALSNTSTNPVQNKVVNTAIANLNTLVGDTSVSSQISNAIANKVDKVDGKGLSTNDYTTDEKNKLTGIASGAEVNQNAFSNVVVGSTTIAADSKTDSLTIVAGDNITLTPDATNDKLTIAAKDTVYTHPTYTSKSSGLYKVTVDGTGHVSATTAVSKSDITALGIPGQDTTYSTATQSDNGLMSSGDKTKLDGIETGANKTVVDSELSSSSTNPVQNKVVNTAISNLNALVGDATVSAQISSAITGQKGTAGGLAELDTSGKVPSSQLPSYVDDVLEYDGKANFPTAGETGKIYVDTSTNITYRWSGSTYVEIGSSLALGETSSTAFRGDYGKIAYDHASANGSAFSSGLYKITTNDQGHVTAAIAVEKADITGLGIPAQDTTYSTVTTSIDGLMSSTDKATLDNLNTLVGDISVSEQIGNAMLDVDYAAGNKYYTATFDGVGTLYSSYSCNLYSVTVNNGKIPSDLTGVEPTGISLIVAFENSSESSSSNYTALRINNSNYYVIGGRNISGSSILLRAAQPFLNNPCRIEFALDSNYNTDSIKRGIWCIPGSYSNYTSGGANFASAVAISKGGTGATTAADALTNLGAVNKAGDTMTGSLTIENSSLRITDPDTNCRGYIFEYNNSLVLDSQDINASGESRRLVIYNATAQTSKDNALVYIDINQKGYGSSYRIFHAGMETPIPIANGGTEASTAAGALTNLGAVAKAGDTMGGALIANATSVATLGTAQVRNIWAGTANISEVEGSLKEGDIYLQYEEG